MSTASEQPKKKRRVDLQKNVESNPSPSQLPLVRPNQIPKSSKDPNRGMYPRIRNKRSAACASFTKASQLLKESSEKKDEPIKNGISDVSNPSVSSDDANVPSTSQSSEYPKKKKNKFAHQTSCYRSASNAKQKIRNRSSVSKSSHKISHYFKPIFRYSNKKTIKKSTNTSVFDGSPPVDCTSNDCYSLPLDGNNIHLSVPDLIYNDFESSNDIPGPSGYVFPQKRSDKEIAETPDRETVFQTTLKETKHLLNDTDTSDSDDGIAQPNYFETLPPHIIELILCQIPFVDLMRNARVCKTWCDIINAENFIEWKKIYYRLKKDSDKGPLHMEWICSQLSIDAAENCFGGLIKFFYQYYKKCHQ
ncbi:DNA helicase [Caerostris darwini]|uniref:DNA helicase n=1 Tax=Caerostris darwini TaxID=1538125 RepID=A0AAV4N6B6_9ARAC|nr:DNA helicase [Caerostris darwini]